MSRFLQGDDTKILEADRALWQLADQARDAGLVDVIASTPADELHQRLGDLPAAAEWTAAFEQMLARYGHRTEGILDPALPSWIEKPSVPLGLIRGLLAGEDRHDFDGARRAAVAEREEAVATARQRLTEAEMAAFDAALGACRSANFAWWNEEHNHYIDLRAHLPLRRAAGAVVTAAGAPSTDCAMFLFGDELLHLGAGDTTWPEVATLVEERRGYFERWSPRRADMPKLLGTIPDDTEDPVLREIFGLGHHFFEALEEGDGERRELVGVPASSGRVEGPARVLRSADDIDQLESGDILVCEATSPNWTPAFAIIGGCVCDSGGTLTHASIVSREYRIPCVTGTAVATSSILDGDIIEVDGDAGTVVIKPRS
ncbi:MAG: PEP-utilizing enzyme [Acidimicrobiales bacterium]